jgi:type II secretory pathway pseudopilin PulG
MFKDVFPDPGHNFALVNTLAAMEAIGAYMLGSKMLSAVKSVVAPNREQKYAKKQKQQAKAMDEAMREAMAENQSRAKPNLQKEESIPQNENFVESNASNLRSADQVLNSIAKLKKQRDDELRATSNSPVPGSNNSF